MTRKLSAILIGAAASAVGVYFLKKKMNQWKTKSEQIQAAAITATTEWSGNCEILLHLGSASGNGEKYNIWKKVGANGVELFGLEKVTCSSRTTQYEHIECASRQCNHWGSCRKTYIYHPVSTENTNALHLERLAQGDLLCRSKGNRCVLCWHNTLMDEMNSCNLLVYEEKS